MSTTTGRPPARREIATMRRIAAQKLLDLADETADEELRYQCLVSVMNFGERVGLGDGVPTETDAEAA